MRRRLPLALFLFAAGIMHFVKPRAYEATVPDALPLHQRRHRPPADMTRRTRDTLTVARTGLPQCRSSAGPGPRHATAPNASSFAAVFPCSAQPALEFAPTSPCSSEGTARQDS